MKTIVMIAACVMLAGGICEAQVQTPPTLQTPVPPATIQPDTTKRIKPTPLPGNNNRDTSMNRNYNRSAPRTTDTPLYRKNGTMR